MAEQNKQSNLEMKRLGSDPISLLKQHHPTGSNTLHSIPPFSALFGQNFGSTPLTTCEGQCQVHPLARSFLIVDKSSNGDSRVFLVPEFSGKRGGLLEGGICTTTATTSATSPSNPIFDAVISSSEGATTRSPIETTTQCFSQHRVNKQEKEKDEKEGEGEEGEGEGEDEDKEEGQSNSYSYFHEDSDEIDALMNSDDYEIEEGEDGEEEEDNDIYGEVTSAFTPLIEEFSASTPRVKGDAANLRKRKGGEREMDSSSTKRFMASGFAEDNLNLNSNLNLNLNLLQEYESTRSVKTARNQKIQECVRMLRKIVPTRGGIGFDPALVLDDVIEHVTMLQNEVASLLQAKTEL